MGWKKIITSLSNAVLNSLTTTGNVSASGNLYADLPSNSSNNGLVVVQDPDTGKLFKTGSYGGGSSGGTTEFDVGGTTGVLTNLNIQDYAGDVDTSIVDGTLTITFGTPTVHTVGTTTVSGFDTDRFDLEDDDYTINWSYNLMGNTFVSGYLQRASVNGTSYENVYSFSNGTTSRTVNSSWNGDTATNLRRGSHRFRIVVTATLANGESTTVYGSPIDKSLSKTDPGNATYNQSYSISPSNARSGNVIEEGATGTGTGGIGVIYTPVNGANNGWTNLGWNSSQYGLTGLDTTPPNITKVISATGANNTGARYQHWDDGDLNSNSMSEQDQAYGSITRMISFRHGMSNQTSWTTTQLQALSSWPGTIKYGYNTWTSGWNANNPNGKYVYFVYKSSLGNVSSVYVDGYNQTGAFIGTTVGNYKVYKTEFRQGLTLSNIVVRW